LARALVVLREGAGEGCAAAVDPVRVASAPASSVMLGVPRPTEARARPLTVSLSAMLSS
jgi:hypothetical protein